MQIKNWMRKIIFLACCMLSVGVYAQEATVFHDTQGNAISADSFKQKWVIITYWSTWCSSCRKDIPELNRFYQSHHNKNVVFYGVNYDQPSLDELKVAVNQSEIAFPVLVEDPNHQVWQFGDISWLPMTFIINPKGQIVKKIVGQNSAESLAVILNALQQSDSSAA